MKLNLKERVGIFFGSYLLTSPIREQWPLPNGTGSRVDLREEGPLSMDCVPSSNDLIGKRILFKKVKGEQREYSFVRVG